MDPTQVTAAASAAHLPPPPHPPPVSAVDHPTPVVNRPHPPYPEMIMAAIMWENSEGKQGSTKKSIANFINRVYTGLPPFHSSLVAHHLKRLTKSGQLIWFTCNTYQCTSFCTPRPESNKQHQCTQGQIPIESAPPQHQFHHPSPDSSAPHHSLTPTPNPEEAQAEAPSQAQFQQQQIASLLDLGEVSSVVVVNEASSRKRPRQSASEEENQLDQVVVPVIQLISEELNGSQVEFTLPEVLQPQPVFSEHLPVDVQVVKRRRGRPAKVKAKVMGVVGVRRGRGRPRKNEQPQPQAQSQPQPVYLEHLPVNEMGVVKRKREWPRKCKLPRPQAQFRPQVRSPVLLQELNSVLVKHSFGQGHEMANDVLSRQEDVELNSSQVELTLPEVPQPQPVLFEHLPVDVEVVKRRRGRPAKAKVKVMGMVGVRRRRGRPKKNEQPQPQAQSQPQPVYLEHLPVNEMGVVKRKRGWPRKCKLPRPQAQFRPQVRSPVLLQELNSVLVKHSFGQGHEMANDVLSRQEDVELNSSQVELTLPEVRQPQPVLFEHLPVDVEVVKRRRGRPAKLKVKVMGVVGVRRRRGRPKKNEQPQPQAQSQPQPVYLEHLPVNEVGVVNRKQRWPRKCKLPHPQAQSRPQVQSPVQLQQLSSVLVKHVSGQGHEMANDVLSKQEDVQSKIREALGVIKPLVVNHSTPDALTALQRLEQLLTTDLTPSSSPAPTSPPRMMMPMNLTDPPGTSVPLPSGSSVPSITVMEPLHLTSSIRNLQPMHWILILKKRALKVQ